MFHPEFVFVGRLMVKTLWALKFLTFSEGGGGWWWGGGVKELCLGSNVLFKQVLKHPYLYDWSAL